MNENERNQYIRTRLTENGINEETQAYVLQYVDMNQNLFGDFLDVNKVTDRIVNNLHHSISTYDIKSNPSEGLKKLVSARGFWDSYEHRVETNPIHKSLSRFSKIAKQHYDSTMMHEIDHCATTEYMDVATYFNMSEDELELNVKRSGLEGPLEEIQTKYDGKLAASGISRTIWGSKNNRNGVTSKNLMMLNEGITAYKQEMYDDFLGIKHKTNYKVPKMVANFIAEQIGQEKMLQLQFDNDYNGIRTAFKEATGQNLDDIVGKLKPTSSIKEKLFGKLYTRKWEKTIETSKQNIEETKKRPDNLDLSDMVMNDLEYAQEMERIEARQRDIELKSKENVKEDTTRLFY